MTSPSEAGAASEAAEGATARLLTSREDIERAVAILAATDRIRYLEPRLHAEMISELRWPQEDNSDGLDILGLELAPTDLATLELATLMDAERAAQRTSRRRRPSKHNTGSHLHVVTKGDE